MEIIWITYIHCSGNETTQPCSKAELEEYKKWLIESGEALKIIN